MQNGSMAAKVKVLFDGEEIPGLVKFGEKPLENGMIEVPSFGRINKVHNGVTTMPEISLTYETQRGTKTRKFMRDWFLNKEVKDVTVIKCDATGVEFEREIWPSTECRKFSEPEVDFSNVSYARVEITLLPYDIIPV